MRREGDFLKKRLARNQIQRRYAATTSKKKTRKRNRKRKGKVVLAMKGSSNSDPAKKAKVESPSKEIAECASCQALAAADQLAEKQKVEYEKIDKEKDDGADVSGKKHGGRGGSHGNTKQQKEKPTRGPNKKEDDGDDDEEEEDESNDAEFQKATEAIYINGGASLHSSHRETKQWVHVVNATKVVVGAQKPLRWYNTPIIFDAEDHPDCTTVRRPIPISPSTGSRRGSAPTFSSLLVPATAAPHLLPGSRRRPPPPPPSSWRRPSQPPPAPGAAHPPPPPRLPALPNPTSPHPVPGAARSHLPPAPGAAHPHFLSISRCPAPTSFLAPTASRLPTSQDPGDAPPQPPPSLPAPPEPQPPWIPASLHHHLLHPTAAAAHATCAHLRPPSGAGSTPRPTPPATRAPAPNRWLIGFPGRRWLVLPLATASSPAVHLRHLLKHVLFYLFLEEKRWLFTVLLVYANDVTRFSCLCVCTNDNAAVFACLCGHGCTQRRTMMGKQ